jgi:hypothetical protein
MAGLHIHVMNTTLVVGDRGERGKEEGISRHGLPHLSTYLLFLFLFLLFLSSSFAPPYNTESRIFVQFAPAID